LSWNQQYSNVFVNMGTYNYHCNIHPNMKGKIIVVE
ncbi:copper-binding protein, partial [Candidatus Micrarchaeota archaeon]|nr:copper-binding protein [Candidatus Micrarchaeota archaeon]